MAKAESNGTLRVIGLVLLALGIVGALGGAYADLRYRQGCTESTVDHLKADVGEIKEDVKTLLRRGSP